MIFDGYDDNRGDHGQLRIKQSYDKWDSGHQYIDYNTAMSLIFPSRFSLIDKADPIITNYKKQIMENITIDSAKTAYTNNFWDGTRPTETVTRQEAAAMIERVYEKLTK